MGYLHEPDPPRGRAVRILPGVRRLVAPNPGKMTYHGTNTYLLDGDNGAVVLDPGPDDASHVAAILEATGGAVDTILVSHHHLDHAGAAPALKQRTGAPVLAFSSATEHGVHADGGLADGDTVAGLTALHTPGHAPDHLSFARPDGVLFTGDHVMAWSPTSVMAPGGGDLGDYLQSLRRLLARSDSIHLPGHGPPLPNPRGHVEDLLRERDARAMAVRKALDDGARTLMEVVNALYPRLDPAVRALAKRSIRPYLVHLTGALDESSPSCEVSRGCSRSIAFI